MQTHAKKKVLAAVSDLFFTVKINDAVKRAGMDVEFLKSSKDVLERAREKPLMVILDLNFDAVEPLDLIVKLKGDKHYKGIQLISYLSHVQGELKKKAHEAGSDMVLAKSAFSQNLLQILKRHAGVY